MRRKRPPRPEAPKDGDWFGPLVAPTVLFVTTALYLGLTAFSTSHQDLVVGKSLELPIVGIHVPLSAFYLFGPFVLFGVHLNLLLRQFMAVEAAREAGVIRPGSDPSFFLALPSKERPRGLVKRRLRYVIKLVFLAVNAALPVGVLLSFQICFLPYHHGLITQIHQVVVVLELGLIWVLLAPMTDSSLLLKESFRPPASVARRSRWIWPFLYARRRPVKVFGMGLSVLVLYLSVWAAAIPGRGLDCWLGEAPWPDWIPLERNLSLAGRTLVAERPPAELVAYVLQARGEDEVAGLPLSAESEPWVRFSRGLNLADRDLRDADLSGARLFRTVLSGADLSGADLRGAHLGGAVLSSGDRTTRLDRADLRGAEISGADFTGASLVAADLREATGTGVSLRDANLEDALAEGVVLNGVDAFAAQMDGIDLRDASLRVARLDEALLRGAMLTGARLDGSTFRNADLTGAWLAGVDARAVDFSYAKTRGAVFESAHLDATTGFVILDMDLAGASVGLAGLQQALHLVQGRETVEYHSGSPLPAPSLSDLRGIDDGSFDSDDLADLEATLRREVEDSPWFPRLEARLQLMRSPGGEEEEGGEGAGPNLRVWPPRGYAQLLVDDRETRPRWLSDVVEPEPAGFFRVLARELTEQACKSDAPQLMEATIRRAVGCTGPREPELERVLARNLIILDRDQREHDRLARAMTDGAPVPTEPPCPALSSAPETVREGLQLALGAHAACTHAQPVAPAPQSLCDGSPFLDRAPELEGAGR